MTNEFVDGYKFAYHPDGNGNFVSTVAPSNKDAVAVDFNEEDGLGVNSNTEGYEVTEVEIILNGEVVSSTTIDELANVLAEIKENLKNEDVVTVNVKAENKFGNTFTFTDSVVVEIEEEIPVEPVDPVDPVEPVDPVDPVIPVEPVKPVSPIEIGVSSSGEFVESETGIITLSRNIVKKGEKIVVFVKNLKANTSYNIYLRGYGKLGVITTDENGLGRLEVEIPDVVGSLSISVTDLFDNYIDLADVYVTVEANL